MSDQYKLEDGFPVPTNRKSDSSKWAFLETMKQGQSFLVPDKVERDRAIASAHYRKIKLITKKVKGTKCYRCWLKPEDSPSVTEPEDEWEVRRAQNDGQIL